MSETEVVETPVPAAPAAVTAPVKDMAGIEKEMRMAQAERDVLLALVNDITGTVRKLIEDKLELAAARLVKVRQAPPSPPA